MAALAAPVLRVEAAADDEDEPVALEEKWVPKTPMEALAGPPKSRPVPFKEPVYPWKGIADAKAKADAQAAAERANLPPRPPKGKFSDATKALGLPSFDSYKSPSYTSRGTGAQAPTALKFDGLALPKVDQVALPKIDATLGSAVVLAAAAVPFFAPSSNAKKLEEEGSPGAAPTPASGSLDSERPPLKVLELSSEAAPPELQDQPAADQESSAGSSRGVAAAPSVVGDLPAALPKAVLSLQKELFGSLQKGLDSLKSK